MKKALLLSAAMMATSYVFAVDLYMVGGNINGSEDWNLGSQMTQTSEGVYEWTGEELGSGFKINNGGWDDAEYNIGAAEGETYVTLGSAIAYITGSDSKDFKFDGFKVINPKVVLDMNAQTLTVTGKEEAVEPGEFALYIIGSNVNGQSWALAQADAKFTDEGNGLYSWKGEELGSGFKINDGTWDNDEYNIGGTGSEISINEPYYYMVGGSSGNIAFAGGFTTLVNPEVELNLNDKTITIVAGEPEGTAQWYIAGINSIYDLDENTLLSQVGESNVYEREVYVVETIGGCKISDDGWAHQYGTNLPEEVYIDPNNLTITLEVVDGQGGDVPYELAEGTYLVQFDLDELTLTFVSDYDGVETIVMGGESKAEYYNLHGQKVENPDRGIFIRVLNGQAVKVVK